MVNKYILFRFQYYFYNYSLNELITNYEYINAKSINDAEKIFWIRMNGRDIKIKDVVYMGYKFRPSALKCGRMFWDNAYVSFRYEYMSDGKTRKS